MSITRKPHAVMDIASRKLKAKKIEIILDMFEKKRPYTMLEVGTGSGGIAQYFGRHESFDIKVDSVDVIDSRLVFDDYNFHLVSGCQLPFTDESYDAVISNHVIEHVGEKDAQMLHLSELSRVLKEDGVLYLALPNKWMLIEPHYKLIFLSWIPKWLSHKYLNLFGLGAYYDCTPLSMGELESMLEDLGLTFENKCAEALKLTFSIEASGSLMTKIIELIPKKWIESLNPAIPTLIYKVSKCGYRKSV